MNDLIFQDGQWIDSHLGKFFLSLSESSREHYLRTAKGFVKFIDKPLEKANVLDVKRYIDSLDAMGKKARTINCYISILKAIYAWLYKDGVIDSDPLQELNSKKSLRRAVNDTKRIDLDIEQIRDEAHKGTRTALLIRFLTTTGVRTGEMVNIKLSDIEEYNGMKAIYIRSLKNEAERTVYIEKDLYFDIMEKFKGKQYLFETKKGNMMNRTKVYQYISNKLGVGGHALRHYWFHHQIHLAGLPLDQVSKQGGHKSIDTTARYYLNQDLAPEKCGVKI